MRQKIFIPFIEGLLSYDCRECGWSCCQSGNLIMNIKERKRMLQNHPSLKYFFTRETSKTYGVRKYPRCWFLENSGLCHIQKEFGYAYKPFICRLHPFYIARCKDEYFVLPEICSTLYVDSGAKVIRHKQILENAKEAIDYGNIHEVIDWPKRRLNLEKKILGDSKKFLNKSNYLDFAAYQIQVTTKNPDLVGIKSKLLEYMKLWKSFLEADELNLQNKRLTYELTAITPLLRLESVQLRYMPPDKVPLALLALYFYMLLFTQIRKPKIYAQTYIQMSNDISSGLIFLEKDDLRIKDMPLEEKISYLRRLQLLNTAIAQKARKTAS